MAEVFKKQTTRWYGPDGQRCKPETPDATRKKELSRKWYGTVAGKPIALCVDKQKSIQLLRKLLADTELARHGLADPYAGHKRRPVSDHLSDFANSLRAKGDSPRHVVLTVSNIQAVLDGTEVVWLADLDAGKASEWLTVLRANRLAVHVPAGQEFFRLAEVAQLLSVNPTSVTAAVRRNGLEATGGGPARRFPRATVEALASRAARGVSPETVNHYVRSLRTFGRWLVRSRRCESNPFDTLDLLNTSTDRRRDRRELTADELRQLLTATQTSERAYRGLTGPERFMLYAMACGTGFRASALASLTPESFDLVGEVATVTLAARHAKNRKTKVQPIPADLAELLRNYLDDMPARQPIWPGNWARDFCGAEMLRGDLEIAGIPYSVEGPDGPLFADFHSLRHTYLTLGGQAGIELRTLQELAGHATPTQTSRYSHRRLNDLAGAIEKLPNFLPTEPATSGPAKPVSPVTHAKSKHSRHNESGGEGFGCSVVAHPSGNHEHSRASQGTEVAESDSDQKQHNLLKWQQVASQGISMHQAGELGFEAGVPQSQAY